jgi:hypothetical protein
VKNDVNKKWNIYKVIWVAYMNTWKLLKIKVRKKCVKDINIWCDKQIKMWMWIFF